MSKRSGIQGILVLLTSMLMSVLACTLTSPAPENPPAFDPTKSALEMQLTSASMQ